MGTTPLRNCWKETPHYAQYTTSVDKTRREEIVDRMKEMGIPVRALPKCFQEQSVFKHLGYEYGDFPKSDKALREVMSLPMYPFISIEEQKEIASKLIELLRTLTQ